MYLQRVVAVVLGAAAIGSCVPSSNHVLHEKRDGLAPRWTLGKRVAPYSRMPMRIGLMQKNLENAHELLIDV